MPLFEFKCDDCGEEFETLVLNSEDNVECSKCNSFNLTKMVSSFGLNLSNNNTSSDIDDSFGCGCHTGCGCIN